MNKILKISVYKILQEGYTTNIKNMNGNTKENLYSSFRVSFVMSWIDFNVTTK